MPAPRLNVHDGVTIVSFDEGPRTLDEASIDEVRAPLLQACCAEPPCVVIDLTNVEFFGSTFIELMFLVWKRLQDRSGHFALCNVSPYCDEVLTVTNLNRLWRTYPTRAAALEAIQASV